MTTTFFLIRHGETQWNAEGRMMGISDIPLTARGKRQAAAVGRLLKRYPIDIIYSSPLLRAKKTAEAIAAHHRKTPLLLHDALKERNFGTLEGKTYEEVNAVGAPMVYTTAWCYLAYQPPGGERLLDTLRRAGKVIHELIGAHEGKTIVIVSHGTFQRVLMCTLLGIGLHELGDIRFDNASFSVVQYHRQQKGVLHVVNYIGHIEGLL